MGQENNELIYCPICGYDLSIEHTKVNAYEICPCCLFQYGIDDNSHDEFMHYREEWINRGMPFGIEYRLSINEILTQLGNLKLIELKKYPSEYVIRLNPNWTAEYNSEYIINCWLKYNDLKGR